MRERIPWALRGPVRRARNAVALAHLLARQRARWRAIAATPARAEELAVAYGPERMPGAGDVVYGGHVKFALLDRELPNAPLDFNVLYLGSSALPAEAAMLVRLARRRGAAFVWNQNGVAYPAWYGDGYELVNRPRAKLLHAADHVFFQSAFCKLSADRFYGERQGPWEVLHNPVDIEVFAPEASRPQRPPTLLLGGNQYQRYRLEAALAAFRLVRAELQDARLIVTGAVDGGEVDEEGVELTGPYTQAEAPELMRRADLLLHTKVNDPCPTVVLEAMACGLPVVYAASGGVPELVTDAAGIGVPTTLDWERDHPPAPEPLAAAVLAVLERLPERSAAARERALAFDARRWIARHRAVFAELTGRPSGLS
jgi:glycosyltransferase involved in cell wall biosynthesis